MKFCSRCKIDKEDSDFRMRFEKRGIGSKQSSYLNNTCRECDNEISNTHYFAYKDNAEWKEKWCQKSREYYHKNKEAIKEKQKSKRQTPEYKKMVIEYRKKNKEKIYQQEKIVKKKYSNHHRDNLTDEYVTRRLCEHLKIPKDILKQEPELIEAKRAQLKLLRSL